MRSSFFWPGMVGHRDSLKARPPHIVDRIHTYSSMLRCPYAAYMIGFSCSPASAILGRMLYRVSCGRLF